jgi:hypothetical protein
MTRIFPGAIAASALRTLRVVPNIDPLLTHPATRGQLEVLLTPCRFVGYIGQLLLHQCKSFAGGSRSGLGLAASATFARLGHAMRPHGRVIEQWEGGEAGRKRESVFRD